MMSFSVWSALMVQLLSPYGNMPSMGDEASWRDWGEVVISLPQITALLPAHPYNFPDWHSWAHELNRSLELLTR